MPIQGTTQPIWDGPKPPEEFSIGEDLKWAKNGLRHFLQVSDQPTP
jgi:hypothetical protein